MRTVLSRVLGVPVEHVDDGSRPGMHDAEIHHPDGRMGAVEFTTLGVRAAMEMESLPESLLLPQTPYWWTLRYPVEGARWKEIQQHVPALVGTLDQLGLRSADRLSRVLGGPAVDWYERSGVSLKRYSDSTRGGGRVDILSDSSGAVVDEHYASLLPWVESLQTSTDWISNVAKLERSGHDELHLAIRLHETGMPTGLASALYDGGEILVGDPAGMEPLSHLWLVPRMGTNLAHWSRDRGWEVRNYATPEEEFAHAERSAAILKKIFDAAERATGHDQSGPPNDLQR